ncbi:MAG: hypothetical protein OXI05_02915 [Bacteroidota bacterium]|nr:hypothetical protein [Bacteroidota bacterium]MXW15374.1 hypothetical protein [Rhodothermaceae bacterium]MDE2644778.1 hypothetical protein [Bacteroidota bacterium]MXW34003.1 hypothetical protein [Rhodothermaceae bacterium]MXZ16897.1 hypothetical protein [Rhodothermaceae bacterium]
MNKPKYNHFRSFYKETLIGLLCVILATTACLVRPSYAQSGIGIGLVASGPHNGGKSVRYKAVQVLVGSFGSNIDDGFYIEWAARYNHSLREWERVNFRIFGQIGRQRELRVSEWSDRYRFAIGISPDFRILGRSSSKGLYLTASIGFSIDHTGYVGTFPAMGTGVHYFF